MQSESAEQEVLGALRGWLARGERAWLCTIVEISGSSPRALGSLMALNAAGAVAGSLSGGCVEDDLLERIRRGDLAAEAPRILVYGLTAAENERLGLPCGGVLRVLVEPCSESTHGAHLEQLLAALARRACVRREVALPGGAVTAAPVETREPLQLGEQGLRHTLGPRFHLVLIGAGQLAQSLAWLAGRLDYRISVCDPRQHLVAAWPGPDVSLVCMMPDDYLRSIRLDRFTAVITLTHDPRIDDMALMEALTHEAFYVGALGSQRTSAKRRARLLELDLDDGQIARLHAPVGLDIGSKHPTEIAIAIMAELIALRRAGGA